MIRLGFHVSISGGIHKAVGRAKALGCNTMQIFSHNPRGWVLKELNDDDVKLFRRLREEEDISPLYIHTAYLINLSSPDKELYRRSKEIFLSEIKRADILDADYLITHLGSIGHAGEEEGIRRVVGALMDISEKCSKVFRYTRVKVLLENTAGERGEIGYSFEQLSEILEQVRRSKGGDIVGGVCLDTCHAYAAGYNLSEGRGIERVIKRLDSLIGLQALKVVHLNDSKRSLGSRIDRHENIGKGFIGIRGFKTFLSYPKIKNIPFILETPKKNDEDDLRNLNVVRGLLRK